MTLEKLEQRLLQIPQILAGINLIQNEYHQFDVYEHTLAVAREIKKFNPSQDLLAAAYLHDIGKPSAAKPRMYGGIPQFDEKGRQRHTFPNHEFTGAEIVRTLDKQIFASLELNQEHIAQLVGAHYLPMKGIEPMRATQNYLDFEKKFHELEKIITSTKLNHEELMNLFAADSIGKGDVWGDLPELLEIRKAILGENNLKEIYLMQKICGGNKYGYAKKE